MSLTDRSQEFESCGACGASLRPETPSNGTWIWRCACGWSRLRTGSGVVSRRRVHVAIARAVERVTQTEHAGGHPSAPARDGEESS